MSKDTVVHPSAPMPKGYTFVSKGNVYITAHCRSATYAANKALYVVCKKNGTASKGGVLGLRCPIHIAKAVRDDERASRSTRHDATTRRDDALATAFRDALLAAYPETPRDRVPQIVTHAMTKKQGRVARTATLGLDQRVRLAVRAHIRHCHTNYDALLRHKQGKQTKARNGHATNTMSRDEARRQTLGQVDATERVWAGKAPKTPSTPASARPTRLSKSAAASRIAQCLQSPRGSSSDAIVVDSSDEDMDSIMVISSDSDE